MERLAALGYAGIEFSIQRDQLAPESWSLAEAQRLKRVAADCGIAIADVHAGAAFLLSNALHEPSLISRGRAERQRRLDLNSRAIDFTADLGVDVLAIGSGVMQPDVTLGDAWSLLLDGIHAALDYARERNVRIMLEPEPEAFIKCTFEFNELRRRLGNPADFGLNLDIGHAQVLYEDIPAVIRESRDALWHVHVEDIANRVHKHLLPGDGQIAFAPAGAALREIGYAGFASFELYEHAEDPEAAARHCIDALQSWVN
jgi:sugar phosphate isomerase/epimerase